MQMCKHNRPTTVPDNIPSEKWTRTIGSSRVCGNTNVSTTDFNFIFIFFKHFNIFCHFQITSLFKSNLIKFYTTHQLRIHSTATLQHHVGGLSSGRQAAPKSAVAISGLTRSFCLLAKKFQFRKPSRASVLCMYGCTCTLHLSRSIRMQIVCILSQDPQLPCMV